MVIKSESATTLSNTPCCHLLLVSTMVKLQTVCQTIQKQNTTVLQVETPPPGTSHHFSPECHQTRLEH